MQSSCESCGQPLDPAGPGGICTRCFARGLTPPDASGGSGASALPELSESGLEPLPRTFGPYELLRRIGRGAFCRVYRARRLTDGLEVALKRLAPGQDDPEIVQRLRRQKDCNLEHPHLVRVHEVGCHAGEHYLEEELMPGSLADRLEAFRDPRRAASLLMKLADAVEYMHRRDIIHRDLKPNNVLLDEADEPKITDFGLVHHGGMSSLTGMGQYVGTPGYMAPEQFRSTARPGPAADIWALGILLYELLTGALPFTGCSPGQLRRAIARDPVRLPRHLEREAGKDLLQIVRRCLEKEAHQRFPTAAELRDDLERYLQGKPVRTRRPGRWKRARGFVSRHPRWSVGIPVALLSVGISLYGVTNQIREREEAIWLEGNAFAARSIAGALGLLLDRYAPAVGQASRAPELPALFAAHDRERFNEYLHTGFFDTGGGLGTRDGQRPFDSWFIHDANGIPAARWPPSDEPDYWTRRYGFRDYFRGGSSLDRERDPTVYMALAHRSEASRKHKFGIAVRIDDPVGKPLGVLVATIPAGPVLAGLKLNDYLGDNHREVVIVARRDIEREEQHRADRDRPKYIYLLHRALAEGETIDVHNPAFDRLLERPPEHRPWHPAVPEQVEQDSAYRDRIFDVRTTTCGETPEDPACAGPPGCAPGSSCFQHRYGERLLAGMARVSNTGLAVIVQTPWSEVVTPYVILLTRLAQVFLFAFAVAFALLLDTWWRSRRRSRGDDDLET